MQQSLDLPLPAALVDRLAADPNDGQALQALAEHHARTGSAGLAHACRIRAAALADMPARQQVQPPAPASNAAAPEVGQTLLALRARAIGLIQAGEGNQALEILDQVLAMAPDDSIALNASGAALLGKKDFAAAEMRLLKAVEVWPANGEAWTNIGYLRQRQRRPREAIAAYREALKHLPGEGRLHNNIGSALEELDEMEEAAGHFAKAVELLPDNANSYNNLGRAKLRRGELAEARRLLAKAIELRPDDDAGAMNWATLLLAEMRYEEAEAAFRRALSLNPERAETWSNLGNLLKDQGNYQGAFECLERALELDPDMDLAMSNLIFTRDFDPTATVESQQAERAEWDRRFGARHRDAILPHRNDPDPDRPLVLGYVSADFKRHSAEIAFGPVLRSHDRSQFRLILYSNVDRPDRVTAQYQEMAEVYHNCLRMTDDEMAEQIRRDGVDVLIDLSGHTAGHRLSVFARKPAPVQVHAWGHVGTGLRTIDYYMSDPVLVRPDERHFYAEEVFDLPAPICYLAPEESPPVSPPPIQSNGFATFGCFNRISKLSARTADCWADLLRQLPDSRLVLKDRTLDDETQRARVAGWFTGRGIDAGRLTLLPGSGHLEHMAAYAQIDIALDPFPQGGGITTCEALWMGVPVVALMGQVPSSRIASAIVANVGLPELVAESRDSYVAKAIGLARDPARLLTLRHQLRDVIARAPIGNTVAYTRAVEAAYRTFWQRWCAGQGRPRG
ncbi:tetratricopeptide repeat protein [Marinibaculum pumilum]|uniref:protein O-GlcNAc transferase n=1 Tax=Marinibaculum pumilum TaxID=1766165 RepID=A0ABV7KXZ1_9PROT